MRAGLPVALLWLSFVGGSRECERPILGPEADVTATRVAFDADDPKRLKAGALTFLGGVRLTSSDPAFGGFSAMAVRGDRFTLLSDGGNVVRFRMGGDWKPIDAEFSDVRDGPGTGWPKYERDTESLAIDPATGRAWIGFEATNMIWRYDLSLKQSDSHSAPHAMNDWSFNGGPESLVRLRSGGFIVISETSRVRHGDARVGLRFATDPTEHPDSVFGFGYAPPAGYDPSDAIELPDGRLLVLNRRVTLTDWFTAKLVLIDPIEILPGTTVRGKEIAAIERPFTRDNFEAMAAVQEPAGLSLWLASDDNLMWPQKSLLMKFRLTLPPKAAAPAITTKASGPPPGKGSGPQRIGEGKVGR